MITKVLPIVFTIELTGLEIVKKTNTKNDITCTLKLDHVLKCIHQILGLIFNTIENVGLSLDLS